MQLLTDPINILSFVLLNISMQIYMGIFFERKRKSIYINLIMSVIVYTGLSLIPSIGTLVNAVVVTSFFGFHAIGMYIGARGKIFFNIILWEALGSLCDFIVLFIFSLSYTKEKIMNTEYYSFARLVSQCIFIFSTLFISRIASKKKYQGAKSQTSLVLLIMALSTVFVDWGVYRIYLYPDSKTDDYYAILIASIMMIISVVIIKIYEGLGERAELEKRNMVYQSQVEAYRVQISEREETMKEFRRLKHDMKNHLIYIDELIRQKKSEDARSYLEELLQSRGLSYQGVVNSGNFLVDGLINYKVPYMRSLHIDFQAEVTIPSELEIPEDNLCIIIGNLLDNAIEGTQKCKGERRIFFELTLKKNNLLLFIQNSCLEGTTIKSGNQFLTTKKDHGHGMGLLSVKRAVEECNGDLRIDEESGIFRVSVILPKESRPEK